MLNSFVWLLLLSITMLIGSFLFGCIPLASKLSETKLRYLTAIGAGLLIGTALVVIIPEGVETLYASARNSALTLPIEPAMRSTYISDISSSDAYASNGLMRRQDDSDDSDDNHNSPHGHDHADTPSHAAVGLALIIGFATMFVIDQLSSLHYHGHKPNTMATATTSLPEENTEYDVMLDPMTEDEAVRSPSDHHVQHVPQGTSMTPTIGLIVHAAADGIALGASASQPELSMVVFFAIMLHKGPSAFALTSVLLAEGLSRITVRRHLLMFSLAAPLGALLTYLVLYATSSTTSSVLERWTGILLLFSGGTFLYVAMHALQELRPLPTSSTTSTHAHKKLDRSLVVSILVGMFLPVLLQKGHSH